jgi:hypothetical protein
VVAHPNRIYVIVFGATTGRSQQRQRLHQAFTLQAPIVEVVLHHNGILKKLNPHIDLKIGSRVADGRNRMRAHPSSFGEI